MIQSPTLSDILIYEAGFGTNIEKITEDGSFYYKVTVPDNYKKLILDFMAEGINPHETYKNSNENYKFSFSKNIAIDSWDTIFNNKNSTTISYTAYSIGIYTFKADKPVNDSYQNSVYREITESTSDKPDNLYRRWIFHGATSLYGDEIHLNEFYNGNLVYRAEWLTKVYDDTRYAPLCTDDYNLDGVLIKLKKEINVEIQKGENK